MLLINCPSPLPTLLLDSKTKTLRIIDKALWSCPLLPLSCLLTSHHQAPEALPFILFFCIEYIATLPALGPLHASPLQPWTVCAPPCPLLNDYSPSCKSIITSGKPFLIPQTRSGIHPSQNHRLLLSLIAQTTAVIFHLFAWLFNYYVPLGLYSPWGRNCNDFCLPPNM